MMENRHDCAPLIVGRDGARICFGSTADRLKVLVRAPADTGEIAARPKSRTVIGY